MSLLGGSTAQLLAWLIRPDRSAAEWALGGEFQIWVGIEAALAVLVGWLGPDRQTVVLAILVGWSMQILHFVALGEHYGDPLWGMGVFIQIALAALAVGVALLLRYLADSRRGRLHS